MVQVINKKPLLSQTLYGTLKAFVQVFLPAAATLYIALAQVWGLSYVQQVVVTITAVATFLGVLLHISSANYVSSGAAYNGTVSLAPNSSGSVLSMNLDPADVVGKDVIHLKVVPARLPVVPQATPTTPLPPSVPPQGAT